MFVSSILIAGMVTFSSCSVKLLEVCPVTNLSTDLSKISLFSIER